MRASRVRTSSRSSSRVSNSLAVEAKSSSSSGSSFSFTERTVTVTSAVSPELGPESSAVWKVGALLGGQPADGVVEALHQVARADLVGHARGRAVLQHLVAELGLEVDGDEVAVLGRALDGLQHAEALAHDGDLLVDLLVGDLDVVDGDRELVQGRQLQLRGDVDLGGELEGVVVLELGHLDLGLAEHADLVLAHDLGVDLRDGVLDDLLQDDGAADALVEHAVGDLARAEAGDADLLAQLLVDLTEGVVQVPPSHLDRHPDPCGAEFLDGALHSGSAPR